MTSILRARKRALDALRDHGHVTTPPAVDDPVVEAAAKALAAAYGDDHAWDSRTDEDRARWQSVARGVINAAREAAPCTCYPNGFTIETYEGPQPWCRAHSTAQDGYDQGRIHERQALADEIDIVADSSPTSSSYLHGLADSWRVRR